jgi:GTPase SAR1 family protein
LENWIKQINESQPDNISKIVVGNKSDVQDSERQVSKSEGEALAKKYGVEFLESSAKDNYNIGEIFNILGHQIKKNLTDTDYKPKDNARISIQKEGGSKSRC